MHVVDTLVINFNPSQMVVLNLAMAFLMFAVALDVRLADFFRVVQFPRSILVGLVGQYLIFPMLTLLLISLFKPPESVALGMVLVSMCPSGNMTNFLVHRAGANVALSVTFNGIIILLASVITPAGFLFWSGLMPGGSGLRTAFDLGFVEMGTIIFQLILLPLLFGMWLNVRFPVFITKVRPWVQRLSLLIFFAILVLALWGNRSNIIQFLGYVFILVAVHNGMGLGSGYLLGRIFRLPEADSRALAFETGVHNTALGLLLIFKFFNGLGGMALVAAWWGIWDLVSGYSLAWYWRRSAKVSGGIR